MTPRPLMMLRLMAGRGAFRGGMQLMQIALAATWGALAYGEFANALGTCTWLALVPTAAEKAALKVLPRVRLIRAPVARLALRIAVAPVAALVVALLVALVIAPDSTVTLYLQAACWQAGTGLLMTVSGLHRLRGKHSLDAAAFAGGSVLIVGATAVAWFADWSPHTLLLVLVHGMAVLILTSIWVLPRVWRRSDGPRPRRLLPAFGRTTWLLGVSELLDSITLSMVFVVLAAAGRVTDSGPFYLALMASSVVCSLVLYQLKLHQPATSANLRGIGAVGARARSARLLGWSIRAGVGFAVALGIAMIVPPARSAVLADGGASMWLVLGVLVLVEMVLAIALMYGGYLLENTDSRILRSTSTAAAVRLVATVAIAVALVPPLGAPGGFAAITLGLSVEAWSLRWMLVNRYPAAAANFHSTPALPDPKTIP